MQDKIFEQEVSQWHDELRGPRTHPDDPSVSYDDLAPGAIEEAEVWPLIKQADGAVLAWTTQDGSPSAAYVSHVVLEGQIYYASAVGRAKTTALHRDPRSAMVFTTRQRATVTARGKSVLLDDSRWVTRWCFALCRKRGYDDRQTELFMRNADTPSRLVLRFEPHAFVGFDPDKFRKFLHGQDQTH